VGGREGARGEVAAWKTATIVQILGSSYFSRPFLSGATKINISYKLR